MSGFNPQNTPPPRYATARQLYKGPKYFLSYGQSYLKKRLSLFVCHKLDTCSPCRQACQQGNCNLSDIQTSKLTTDKISKAPEVLTPTFKS